MVLPYSFAGNHPEIDSRRPGLQNCVSVNVEAHQPISISELRQGSMIENEGQNYESEKFQVNKPSTETNLRPTLIEKNACGTDTVSGIPLNDLKNDPKLRTVTVRSCIIGVLMGILGASVAQLFVYKPVSLHVPSLFLQLACYVIGLGFSKIPGPRWWNPGRFSSKETGFSAIMATSASIDTIAVQMLSAQDLYFDHRVSAIMALAIMMSSQLIGYGWAGLFQSLLIYPASTPYPSIMPSVALIKSLDGGDRVSRQQLKFFKKTIVAIALYEVFPTYLAPALQAISPWCLSLPKSPIVTQLFGGSQVTEGLGLFAFSFDWATLSSFGPLFTPFITQLNQWAGVLISIFLYMAGYTYDWFEGGVQRRFPFMTYDLLNATGGVYNTTAAVFRNGTENKAGVKQMGIPRLATSAIISKTFACLSASSSISSALLYKWRDMKALIMRSSGPTANEDPHRTLVRNYRQFPTYGTVVILLVSSILALIASHYSESGLSIFGMLVALTVSAVLSISAGFVFASTGVVVALFTPVQLLGGLLFPGNALATFWFNTFASTSTYQCLNILKEMKLGQYLLLSPMSVIMGQLFGSILGTFMNYLVMDLVLRNERDVLLLPNGDGALTGIHILAFKSAAVSWGVFGHELYIPGKRYSIVVYGMIAGLFAPIPIYLLHKWKPSFGFDKFNLTVFSQSVPNLVGTLASGQMTAIGLGFWSQFYMRRYHATWFHKYNNILNAALLGGTEITILILLLFFQGGAGWTVRMPHYFLNPKGPRDYCSIAKS